MNIKQHDLAASLVVLLVEDEMLIRMCMREALDDAGLVVVEAADGREALGILQIRFQTIRVVFTDVQMPGQLDGIGLAHHTAQHWPWIALLITSANAWASADPLPIRSRFLPKPYKLDHAVQHIRQLATLPEV